MSWVPSTRNGWEGGCLLRIRHALDDVILSATENLDVIDYNGHSCDETFIQSLMGDSGRFRDCAHSLHYELRGQWWGDPAQNPGWGRPAGFPIGPDLHEDIERRLELLANDFGRMMADWGWDEGSWGAAELGFEYPLICEILRRDLDALRDHLESLDNLIWLNPTPKHPIRSPHRIASSPERYEPAHLARLGWHLHDYLGKNLPILTRDCDPECGRITARPFASMKYYPWETVLAQVRMYVEQFKRKVESSELYTYISGRAKIRQWITNLIRGVTDYIDNINLYSYGQYFDGLPIEDLEEFALALDALSGLDDGYGLGAAANSTPGVEVDEASSKPGGLTLDHPGALAYGPVPGASEQIPPSTILFAPEQSTPAPPQIILCGIGEKPLVGGKPKSPLSEGKYRVLSALIEAWPDGLSGDKLVKKSGISGAVAILSKLAGGDLDYKSAIHLPAKSGRGGYRLHAKGEFREVRTGSEKDRKSSGKDQASSGKYIEKHTGNHPA